MTTICRTTMVTNVNTAIRRTSQPFHTGFSIGTVALRKGVRSVGARGSGALGIGAGAKGACGSALTSGCGSNCGLSEDDKTHFLQLRTDKRELRTGFSTTVLPKYPASACPVYDFFTRATVSGVPWATIRPP